MLSQEEMEWYKESHRLITVMPREGFQEMVTVLQDIVDFYLYKPARQLPEAKTEKVTAIITKETVSNIDVGMGKIKGTYMGKAIEPTERPKLVIDDCE